MPKSKRHRVHTLTKTSKKGSELKKNIVASLREAVDEYGAVFVFSFENMRTNHLKDVRMELRDSRMFLGKNKVMKVALGRHKEEEYADELHRLARDLSGNVGLLFTKRSEEEILKAFKTFQVPEYPRGGFCATETIVIPKGPLPQFTGSMVQTLRELGLLVDLKNMQVILQEDTTLCTKGNLLTPEQAKLLTHFDRKMAEFRLQLVSVWSGGKYQRLSSVDHKQEIDDSDDDDAVM
uniref:Ribosome assembly factor mrt4 n=1 Tax=Albugo laibachii Nc14 TaxID=890382 RepID=F0VZH9_9STRA|nr:mRNA turnover protein 4 putative [Albugo laibachii Nc14]|eukprot:CCA14209.1 mRNA turnover protein 4 putative [Albugo laibachii Nc14]